MSVTVAAYGAFFRTINIKPDYYSTTNREKKKTSAQRAGCWKIVPMHPPYDDADAACTWQRRHELPPPPPPRLTVFVLVFHVTRNVSYPTPPPSHPTTSRHALNDNISIYSNVGGNATNKNVTDQKAATKTPQTKTHQCTNSSENTIA